MRDSCFCARIWQGKLGSWFAVRLMMIGAIGVLMTGCALPPPETLENPPPMKGSSGKFLNPYLADGKLAAWADKGIHANRMGAAVAGFAASTAIGMVDPTGLVAMGSDAAIKQQAAIGASGGPEYMKTTSETSFDRRQDFAVYLYVNHSKEEQYKKLTQFLAEIYPELGWNYESDIRNAAKKKTGGAAG